MLQMRTRALVPPQQRVVAGSQKPTPLGHFLPRAVPKLIIIRPDLPGKALGHSGDGTDRAPFAEGGRDEICGVSANGFQEKARAGVPPRGAG
jgi:hypothetical protein